MIAESFKNSAASGAMAKPLRRGRACMNCRFLKIKCDGVKPACGPCRKHPKDDECEYADGSGRSRVKVLEDTISRLETRVRELEHPDESTPSVTLHDPYSRYHQSLLQPPPSISTPEAHSVVSSSTFSPASSSSSLPSIKPWRNSGALKSNQDSVGSSGSSSSPQRQHTSSPFLGSEEPDIITIKSLLDGFLPHCGEFGFFLDRDGFRETSVLPLPFGHSSRPAPVLLSAVYLWGVHLSQSEALLQQEQSFLFRALIHAATGPSGSHPDVILHTLQAEILLSYYLLRIGRLIEAKCHTMTAVLLALAAGLHKMRSTQPMALSIPGLPLDAHVFPPLPRDDIQEIVRLNGFYALVVLHKCMMVALEPPLIVGRTLKVPGIQADTPWLSDILRFPEGLSPDICENNTISNFLLGTDETGYHDNSIIALEVKAVMIFCNSVQFASRYKPNMQPHEIQSLFKAFQLNHRIIERFRDTLPPLTDTNEKCPPFRTLIFSHALVDAATIKLHNYFLRITPLSRQCCLEAARRIVYRYGFNTVEAGPVNPLMGTPLVVACRVLITEISRARSFANLECSEDESMKLFRSGMAALTVLSNENAFARYQLAQIQEAFSCIIFDGFRTSFECHIPTPL